MKDQKCKLCYTYALQISKDILRYAEVIELGLYIGDNVVDNGAIDVGLNNRYTVIKRASQNAPMVSSSPQSYSTSRRYAPGTVDNNEHYGWGTGGEWRGQGEGIYRRLRLREEVNSGSSSAV